MEPIYRPQVKKPDMNSIKTTTLLSFVAFGAFLIIILWIVTSFFINTYYSSMKTREAIGIATNIESQYAHNPQQFETYAIEAAGNSGIYIQLDTMAGESHVYDGISGSMEDKDFKNDIKKIENELMHSGKPSISRIVKDNATNSNSRLVYASYVESWEGISTLYIIAPLYPDHATINIVQNMLIYISMIVLLISIILAIYLSHRLSKPIGDITSSAKELSKGNFNVRFDGKNFTETKELANALNKASYEMERADNYQREIMANISHDLKTPLTMIRGYAEKIQDISGDDPKKRDNDLNTIITETERLNGLVTDMMTLSNLQSNTLTLNKEVFDLVQATKEVAESFLLLESTEGYEIKEIYCKPTYVRGDKNKVMQVMANFISNAVKYSGENKYVEIQVKRAGKKVAFHCKDHGVGIPSDELQHVWDRYYRTSANHAREIEGTGLGLSIAKGILTLHNASYGVNSKEGKGSDFWFDLETVKKPNDKKNE